MSITGGILDTMEKELLNEKEHFLFLLSPIHFTHPFPRLL